MKMLISNSPTMLDKVQWVWKKHIISNVKIKKPSHPASAESFGRTCLGFSPLWCRIVITLWAIVIIVWSLLAFRGPVYLWPIYMTHWGLLLILSESACGIAVALASKRGCLKDEAGLPWYVRVYWVLYNTSIAVAFLISVFYWILLYGRTMQIHFALNLNLHGANSALMALELMVAAHPSRVAHCYQPMAFALIYVLFSVVYYFAGGVDANGHPWIYPVMDWTYPKQTCVMVTLTALSLMLVHVAIVVVATVRDSIVTRCRRKCLEDGGNEIVV